MKFGRGRGVNKILKMGGWVANQYNKGGGGVVNKWRACPLCKLCRVVVFLVDVLLIVNISVIGVSFTFFYTKNQSQKRKHFLVKRIEQQVILKLRKTRSY